MPIKVKVSARTVAAATLALLVIAHLFTPDLSAQAADGVVRGEVIDSSGAVLPGVTVTATTADGRVLATTVTDGVGRYVLSGLPIGPVKLAFQLQGFDSATVDLTLQAGTEARVVQRLGLAQFTEQVVVIGKAPIPPPPPPRPAPPPEPPYVPPPPPKVIPIPAEELETVCRPAKPGLVPESSAAIQSHRYDSGRTMYVKGDVLLISGGTRQGLQVGRNLVVRRHFRANSREAEIAQMGEHTAGLVQIVAVDEGTATAIVVHACNELMKGDVLEPFRPEPVRTIAAAGTPAYDDAARILYADAGQLLGVARRLMVIDRGSEQGMQTGQRLTLFRRKNGIPQPIVLGEAVVISVRYDSSTIRIVTATDAIEFGDLAAPQR